MLESSHLAKECKFKELFSAFPITRNRLKQIYESSNGEDILFLFFYAAALRATSATAVGSCQEPTV